VTLTTFHDGLQSDGGHLKCEVPFHLTDIAWYCANMLPTGARTVGGKWCNGWKLCDMSGNVSEWCSDWYGTYPVGTEAVPASDPYGSGNSFWALRGGSWADHAASCRSAARAYGSPGFRGGFMGFRLARSL